ncbi:MAG: helix-turn-helix domain-containing protein [Caulobacter sp.]|nr:helix-turn-helix domain-containing protein [Caulobacter sp.]
MTVGRRKSVDDETLLAHARAVFLERGAFGTTKDIARRAGVSEAVIFQRFPTKAELFLAAMMPRDVDADSIIASEITDTQAALVETGRRLLDHFRQVIPMATHLMLHPDIKMSEVVEHFGAGRVDRIADLLTRFMIRRNAEGLLRVDDPQATANLMIAAIHSLAVYEMMELHKGDDLGHAVPLFVKALWSGMAPGPPDRGGP